MNTTSLRQRARASLTGVGGGRNTSSILPQTHNKLHNECDNENTTETLPRRRKMQRQMKSVIILCLCLCLSVGVFFGVVGVRFFGATLFLSSFDNSKNNIISTAASSAEENVFATPPLTPGQVSPLRWSNDNTVVQQYGSRVGLPPQLIPTLTSYVHQLGLLDIMQNMLYENPLQPGDDTRWFSFQSPYQKRKDGSSEGIRNFTWNVERPESHWKSDMHWFNTADELAHEDSLRALAKGGFDQVLQGIGAMYGLDTLHVDSVGFVAVTNCERGFMHHDWVDVDGRAFNFLFGIHSPVDSGAELYVGNDEGRRGELQYGSNHGVLVGDGTRHGTKECDHRSHREVRVTCTVYLADVTDDNLALIAGDSTSIFPPTGDVGVEWTWTQRGRHWNKNGGPSLMEDVGRKSFYVQDDNVGECEKDICLAVKDENDIGEYRNECMRTCEVFMDDRAYRPGERRHDVLGY